MDMISEGIKISLKCCVKDDCNKCNYLYSTCYRGLARDALEQIEELEELGWKHCELFYGGRT